MLYIYRFLLVLTIDVIWSRLNCAKKCQKPGNQLDIYSYAGFSPMRIVKYHVRVLQESILDTEYCSILVLPKQEKNIFSRMERNVGPQCCMMPPYFSDFLPGAMPRATWRHRWQLPATWGNFNFWKHTKNNKKNNLIFVDI